VSFNAVRQAKYSLIDQGLPVGLVIDFGPSFCPQYLNHAAQNGAQHALAVDAHLPTDSPQAPDGFAAGVDYHKADFSKDAIVPWISNYRKKHAGRCFGIMFDTLLHQHSPLRVMRNLLSVLDCICLGCPVLSKGGASCVFLPAVPISEQETMFPKLWMPNGECDDATNKLRFVAPNAYERAHWLWGLSADLLRIWMQREGFQITIEKRWEQSTVWSWWGCYAVRA